MARQDPSTINMISGWWRGDSATNSGTAVTTENAGFNRWKNRITSDGTSDATQATAANRPLYTGTPKPGGQWANDRKLVSTAGMSALAQTFFAVVTSTSNGPGATILGSNADGGPALRWNFGKMQWVNQGRSTVLTGNTNPPMNQIHIESGYYDTIDSRLYINGTLDGTGGGLMADAGRTAVIGAGYGGGEYWQGKIFEVIKYDRVLTAAERAQVHSYLSDYYSITVSDYVADGPSETLHWYDGSTEVPATYGGWWDGTTEVASRFEGRTT